jgi:hypothetical protein
MDGEKKLVRVKRELEDDNDNHLIIDEDCTDDESELTGPPIKRVKIEEKKYECSSGIDPAIDHHHIIVCKTCCSYAATRVVRAIRNNIALPLPPDVLSHVLVFMITRLSKTLSLDETKSETFRLRLRNVLGSAVLKLGTLNLGAGVTFEILRGARSESTPELINFAEHRIRELSTCVETCARVYADADETLPGMKQAALTTFKEHLTNKFARVECDTCGGKLILPTRPCIYHGCNEIYVVERQYNICAAKHNNTHGSEICYRAVNGGRCVGIMRKTIRRVHTEGVPDSVIAELFRLSQE